MLDKIVDLGTQNEKIKRRLFLRNSQDFERT